MRQSFEQQTHPEARNRNEMSSSRIPASQRMGWSMR